MASSEKKNHDNVKLTAIAVVNSEVVEVVEMPENLESKVDLILARLETMDKKLENINTAVSNLESKFNKLPGR